jgi:Phage tail tube protein, GTA-gp10
MANPYRGEVPFELDGRTYGLRLTLGSLAHLEDALGAQGLQALGDRLSGGHVSARDICQVLAAGFHGAGHAMEVERIASEIPASAVERAATTAALLLAVTFGGGTSSRPPPPQAAD